KRHPGIWFGWSGRAVGKGHVTTRTVEHNGLSYIVTDLIEEDFQDYYYGFANRVLWPILHYRLDLADFSGRELGGYLRVNDHFARYLTNECHMPSSDRRTFSAGARTVRLGTFPVGVETAEFNRLARRALRSSFVRDVLASLSGRSMIIGVDRLDYSKGITLRM